MNFGPKSALLFIGFCLSSVLTFAQGTTCSADGKASAPTSAIGCVTGTGAQIRGAAAGDTQGPDANALPPDQRPNLPPVVTFENGRLTIIAKNSTLEEVLEAVASKTGAVIDAPEDNSERVVAQLGPGAARDVIASLLNGSHFNYVVVGTEQNPSAVARVILTAKTQSTPGSDGPNTLARNGVQPRNAVQQAVMRPYQEMLRQQQAQAQQAQQAAMEAVQAPAVVDPPADNPEAPAPVAAAPANTGVESAAVDVPAPAPNPSAQNNNSGDKTPTQVLQDLYETRRQMIQQQKQPPQQAQQ